MKKLYLFLAALAVFTASHAQIKMNSSGNVRVGGGVPNSHKFSVSGTASFGGLNVGGTLTVEGLASSIVFVEEACCFGAYYKSMHPTGNNLGTIGKSNKAFSAMYAYNFITVSDSRQKENVKNLEGSLEKVLNLRGLKYDYKLEFSGITDSLMKDGQVRSHFEKVRKNQIGFMAQEVNEILPEAVLYDDSTDVYAIDYTKIVPVLVEAIKEQQAMIEKLKTEVASSRLREALTEEERDDFHNVTEHQGFQLEQNFPNPFSRNTEIRYFIPEDVRGATLYVYNLNGLQLKSIPLAGAGKGSITINGGELKAGMYLYSLVADGKLVDTKKMILTE